MSFTLLRAHSPDGAVALGDAADGGNRSAADLARDARAIAQSIPEASPGSQVLVACADRYAFAACLLAAWGRGHGVTLPPNAQERAALDLAAHTSVRAFLHDDDRAAGTSVLPLLSRHPAPLAKIELDPIEGNRPVVTLFTSGSAGTPRACAKTADQLLGEADMLGSGPCSGLRRIVVTVPAIHIYGLLFGVAVPLLCGGAFVRRTPLHAETVALALRSFQADGLVTVPAHLRALEVLAPGAIDPGLRVFSSGAALPPAVGDMLRSRFGVRVTEVLGSSETGGIAKREHATARWAPFAGVRVSAAADGQMLLESPFAPPDGPRPLPCADRIEVEADGTFRHLGRADNVVKVASKRVDLDEIQRVLVGLPGVVDAAVIAEPTASARGVSVYAAVVAPTWSPATLLAALRDHFDPAVLPRRIVCVAQLPREATGKLPRERLLALLRGSHHVET
jgi:acyl-coenzyme A synthetase/AMP-(fatty) acid ligase